jgi:hypothetical protein
VAVTEFQKLAIDDVLNADNTPSLMRKLKAPGLD